MTKGWLPDCLVPVTGLKEWGLSRVVPFPSVLRFVRRPLASPGRISETLGMLKGYSRIQDTDTPHLHERTEIITNRDNYIS
jgi:hypothetical protein